MSCPLEKFARVIGKCPVCLAEHEAGPSTLPGLIAEWPAGSEPAPPDLVVSMPDPKPDELTVDDVLGVLTEALKRSGKRGVDMGACLLVRQKDGQVGALVGTFEPEFFGPLPDALAWVKRRGLLG